MVDRRDLDLNRRRDLEIIADLVSPGDRVLDLGCGDGMFLRTLRQERGAEVLGIEIDQNSIIRCIATGCRYSERSERRFGFADDNSFDLWC